MNTRKKCGLISCLRGYGTYSIKQFGSSGNKRGGSHRRFCNMIFS